MFSFSNANGINNIFTNLMLHNIVSVIESLIPALVSPSKPLLTKWIKALAFSMGDHLPSGNHGSHNLDQAYPSFLIDNYYCTGTQNLLKHFTIRHYNCSHSIM